MEGGGEYRELDVAGNDAGLLIVAGNVAGELENLGSEVLEHSAEVHGSIRADARPSRDRQGPRCTAAAGSDG